jgi:hypothetical protein
MNAYPKPLSAERLEALFRPIGELIINWSLLDSQIVKMVAILYHTETGRSLAPDIPREFSRRVRFLRKCVSKSPELSNFVNDMRRMLATAKEMVVVRDAFVHGAVSHYDETDQRYSFVKLDIDKTEDIHVANIIRMTLDDIEAHVVVSQDLMAFAIKVTDYVAKTFT